MKIKYFFFLPKLTDTLKSIPRLRTAGLSLKDPKRNTQQSVAGTDQQILLKLQQKKKHAVKRVNARLQKGGEHFQHLLYSHTVYHILDIFEKN
jgi:hypothetical protein